MSSEQEAEDRKQYGQLPSWKLQLLMSWRFALNMKGLHTNHSARGVARTEAYLVGGKKTDAATSSTEDPCVV